MTTSDIIEILENQKNTRGIAHWNRLGNSNWTSYGIGLTQLKKIAKKIGRQHELGKKIWNEPVYDLKILGILIMDPKLCTSSDIDAMVNEVDMWMLSHTWVQNLFCKVSFAKKKAETWRRSEDDLKRRCGYAYLYYLARNKKVEDSYFVPILNHIEKAIQSEENFVKDAMNNALFAIGQRSSAMNKHCISISKNIGKIEVDYGDNSCQPVDVIKHLTSERLQIKFS